MPVTVAAGEAVSGFDRQGLTRLFRLAEQKEKPVAGPWLFETLDKFLAAVIHATRQVPPDHMMWTTPDRDRPFKVFCYHILVDPIHVLDAIASGKYDGNFKLTYGEKAAPFGSMDEIVRFGEETRARLGQASRQLSRAALERAIDSYAGPTSGDELFYSVLSHTAHHLRQLYEMLRMIGVNPAEPLAGKDFAGIAMPKEIW